MAKQISLRLSDEEWKALDELVAAAPLMTGKVGVLRQLLMTAHARMKEHHGALAEHVRPGKVPVKPPPFDVGFNQLNVR